MLATTLTQYQLKVSTYTTSCQKILSKQPRYSARVALHDLVPANTSEFDSH